jgi:putative FmdB family regulatory protein
MPIYEFECVDCKHTFEKLFLSMVKEQTIHCPDCQSAEVRKKISLFASGSNQPGVGNQAACTTST